MSRLLDFYRGTGTDGDGRTIAQVWAFSDDEDAHIPVDTWRYRQDTAR